jgi:hypothetical protein
MESPGFPKTELRRNIGRFATTQGDPSIANQDCDRRGDLQNELMD